MLPLQTGYIGSSVVFLCNITLNTVIGPDLSVLTYYWYHNNIDITNRSEILEQNKEINATTIIINITSIQTLNAGKYICRAGIVGGNLLEDDTILCVKGIHIDLINLDFMICFSSSYK